VDDREIRIHGAENVWTARYVSRRCPRQGAQFYSEVARSERFKLPTFGVKMDSCSIKNSITFDRMLALSRVHFFKCNVVSG
jgi:hypothetical protein